MDNFIDFLVNNYLWLVIISLIIIFALIGYLVDSSTPKSKKKIKQLKTNSIVDNKVHPAVEAYTNEDFDDPLIH